MTVDTGLKSKLKSLAFDQFQRVTTKLDLQHSAESLRIQVIDCLIFIIAIFLIPINALVALMTPNISMSENLYLSLFGCLGLLGLRALLKKGNISVVARTLSAMFICIPMLMLYFMGTVSNLLIAYCLLSIVISSFLLSERMTFVFAGVTILGSITLLILEIMGRLPQKEQTSTGNETILFIILIILVTVVLQIESIYRKKLRLTLSKLQSEHIERTKVEKQLSHTSLHDGLTHLPNRNFLKQNINRAIIEHRNDSHKRFALLYLDLNKFKTINDSLGHAIGDQFLIEFGNRISQGLNDADIVSRVGGDEFAILLNNITSRADGTKVADKILSSLDNPLRINNKTINMSASIGISYSRGNYNNADEALRDADIAMYESKQKGKNTYTVFDNRLQQKVNKQLELENDFPSAIEKEELLVYYQPIIDLQGKTIAGFEGLVRWQHPKQGIISPASFIPIAEEIGVIQELNMYVLKTAAEQFKVWKESTSLPKEAYLSINISATSLETPFYAQKVTRLMDEVGFNPNFLTLEITEGLLANNLERNILVLEKLQAKGIGISIDDFGAGYSSLSYLHKLPLDNIKIDKSFVIAMNEGEDNLSIIETIIALANRLDLNLIAEGIETPEQLTKLQELNCDYGQGFFYSEALSHEQIPEYLDMVYN